MGWHTAYFPCTCHSPIVNITLISILCLCLVQWACSWPPASARLYIHSGSSTALSQAYSDWRSRFIFARWHHTRQYKKQTHTKKKETKTRHSFCVNGNSNWYNVCRSNTRAACTPAARWGMHRTLFVERTSARACIRHSHNWMAKARTPPMNALRKQAK